MQWFFSRDAARKGKAKGPRWIDREQDPKGAALLLLLPGSE
jgi:hypothetical protein